MISHLGAIVAFGTHGQGIDASAALKMIEEELRKGEIPSGPITEANFAVPEGFPNDVAQKFWLFVARLVSMGYSKEEMHQAIKRANDTLRLPARIEYKLKNYTIFPKYDEIWIGQNSDGSVSVQIPYEVVSHNGKDVTVDSIEYESNGTNFFHVLYRYPKKRTYLVRWIDPDSCVFMFRDLETGKILNKTARMNIGLFSNGSHSFGFDGAIVAVPGHFEETSEIVQSQVSNFKVLLPAYDPLIVDTSLSSTNVAIGQVIAISAQIRNPQEGKKFEILLGVKVSDRDAFDIWAGPKTVMFPSGSQCPPIYLYLKPKRSGTYAITIYFAEVKPENFDVVFANGEKSITYTVDVTAGPPRLRIDLSSRVITKFANLTVTLLNEGEREARNVKLSITGDVEGKGLEIDTIKGFWSRTIMTKLLSPIAKANVTVVYFDSEGKRYANSAIITISTTNFVIPEEWRSYIIEVKGYEETKRVFVQGYRGATLIEFYLMASNTALLPGLGSLPIGGPPMLVFIPMSPDGFTINIGNASDISEALSEFSNVRYVLLDVKPSFSNEKVMREDELKELFHFGRDERLEPSKIPSGYEIKLLLEEVLDQKEIVTATDDFYQWLKLNNWEDEDHKYEDTGETRWNLDKATTKCSHDKTIELIYRPLSSGEGNLVKGILVRNYAASEMDYALDIVHQPSHCSPETCAIRVQALGSTALNLVQLDAIESPLVMICLRYGDRIVAWLEIRLVQGEVPEFWRGFWDAIKARLPGIVLSTGLLLVIGYATGGTGAVLVAGVGASLSGFLLHYLLGSQSEAVELASMLKMTDYCGRLSEYLRAMSKEFEMDNATFLAEIARLRAEKLEEAKLRVIGDTGLDLLLQFSFTDLLVAIGLEEASEFRKGYAYGNIVASALSFMSYLGAYHVLESKLNRLKGMRSPLDILKGAAYNWVTPAIYDLAELIIRNFGVKKGGEILAGLAVHATKAIVWQVVSRDFENHISKIESPDDLIKESEIFDRTRGLCKALGENDPRKLLELVGRIENSLGRSDAEGLVSMLEEVTGSDEELGRALVSWLCNLQIKLTSMKLEQVVSQIVSTHDLIANEIGRIASEEFLTIITSGKLTDVQVIDISNAIVSMLPELKAFGQDKAIGSIKDLISIGLQFPREFNLFDHRIELRPFKKVLRIDEWEISIEKIELTSKHDPLGVGLTLTTPLKGIYRGDELILRFYQDRTCYVEMSGQGRRIESLKIENGLIEIVYQPSKKFIAPLNPRPLEYEFYDIGIDMNGKRSTSLLMELRKRFIYDDVEDLRLKIKDEEDILRIKWDNNKITYCANEGLDIGVPEGATKIVGIERAYTTELDKEILDLKDLIEKGLKYENLEGLIGEDILWIEHKDELLEKASTDLKIPKEDLILKEGDKDRGPDFFIKTKDGKTIAIVEGKTTINPIYFDDRMSEAISKILNQYFPGEYSNVPNGYAVAIQFDPDAFLATHKIGMIEMKLFKNG